MKQTKLSSAFIFISTIALLLLMSGCVGEGLKKINPNLELDYAPVDEEESAMNDLTPIVTIGDDVAVAVYKCSTDTDCNRCDNGDVYGQTCIDKTCQGTLELIEDCKDKCSAGQCIDEDILTGEYTAGAIGDDIYLIGNDEIAIVDNDDLLPDETQCPTGIEKCPNYQYGIGSVHLTKFPECKCAYIYVPAGCNPTQPPCPDFSSKTDYPDCACVE